MTKKPKVVILPSDDPNICNWMSDGWGHNRKLMAKARKAIADGDCIPDVVQLLEEAGFEVIQLAYGEDGLPLPEEVVDARLVELSLN